MSAASQLVIQRPVPINAEWEALDGAASRMRDAAGSAVTEMDQAESSWQVLRGAYQEPMTQEVVWSAFDTVPEVTREWGQVLAGAADAMQQFAASGRPMQHRAEGLHVQADQLQSQVSATDFEVDSGDGEGDDAAAAELVALRRRIRAHNHAVAELNAQWNGLEEQIAAQLDALSTGGGEAHLIPDVHTAGHDSPAGMGPAGDVGGGLGAGLGISVGAHAGGGLAGFGFLAGHPSAGGIASGAGGRWGISALSGEGFTPGFALGGLAASLLTRLPATDKVSEAEDLYEQATADDVTGEDMTRFYDHLAEMDADEIEDFAESTPQINQYSMPLPSSEEQLDSWPTGAEGADWWETMEENGTQNAMLASLPLLTGNTEGVKYSVRDTANQNAMDKLRDSEDLDNNQLNRLDNIQESLDDGPGRMLLSLNMGQDPTSPGPGADPAPSDPLAAVSVGNPDEADTTSFNVSGMKSDAGDMPERVNDAQGLYDGLNQNSEDSHAVVSWIGYDSPNATNVLGDGRAEDGSWALAYALDGYRETMNAEDRETRINVNAHSYGTSTAAYALTRTTHYVDTYSMYGSAGIPDSAAEHASDLRVARTEEGRRAVYATDAASDGTSNMGRFWSFRADPTDEDFGAYTFSSDSMGNPPGYPVSGHGQSYDDEDDKYGYLDEEGQAFESLWRIMDGRADEIDEKTDTTKDYYDQLFDQHVEPRTTFSDYRGNTYSVDTDYDVDLGGEVQQVNTRAEAMALVNEHYADKDYCPAPKGP